MTLVEPLSCLAAAPVLTPCVCAMSWRRTVSNGTGVVGTTNANGVAASCN